MPKIFTTLDKIRPAYDFTYKVVLFICKILLIADILITTMSVIGRYVPFIPDPSWSEEVVLTCMSYMAVLSAALAIRRGAHIRMTAFDMYLPKKVVKALDILSDVAVMILGVVMMAVGFGFDGGRYLLVVGAWACPINELRSHGCLLSGCDVAMLIGAAKYLHKATGADVVAGDLI